MSITVITVCLNAAETLAATIDSVHEQLEMLHEYIVVDGGSADETMEILAGSEADFEGRLRWISEPDGGIYDAMNKGIALATGSFLVFLGADDLLAGGALESISKAADASAEVDLVYGDAWVVEPGGRRRFLGAGGAERRIARVARNMPSVHQACSFSARAFDRLGGFDTSFRIAADYEFFLRFDEAAMCSHRVDAPLAIYGLQGVSSRSGLATAREYRRARVLHGVSPSRAWLAWALSIVNLSVGRVVRRLPALDGLLSPGRWK